MWRYGNPGLDFAAPMTVVRDELVLAVEQCRYTHARADAITAVADEIEEVIRAWRSPFCDGWESFQPDPAWPMPALH